MRKKRKKINEENENDNIKYQYCKVDIFVL